MSDNAPYDPYIPSQGGSSAGRDGGNTRTAALQAVGQHFLLLDFDKAAWSLVLSSIEPSPIVVDLESFATPPWNVALQQEAGMKMIQLLEDTSASDVTSQLWSAPGSI